MVALFENAYEYIVLKNGQIQDKQDREVIYTRAKPLREWRLNYQWQEKTNDGGLPGLP